MRDLVLYCNSFPGHEPRHRQVQQRDLMCNAQSLDPPTRQSLSDRHWCFDDTGANIGAENPWLGDLTGLYWVWKNAQDAWVGTNQYRRFYHDPALAALQHSDNTLWISAPVTFDFSLAQQYRSCHGDIGLHLLWEAARQQRISLSVPQVESLDRMRSLSPCNMFFAPKPIFDRLCGILFDIIFELRDGTRYCLPYIQTDPVGKPQTRILAFLAERILTVIYHHHQHFLGDINIVPIAYSTHGHR